MQERLNDAHQEMERLRSELEQVREVAATDGLTGLLNRRAFDQTLNEAINQSGKAQPVCLTMLDIDHGTYPYVTSSSTISAGACTGLGINPKDIGKVTGIVKAYCTRVGNGPFPTEDHGEIGERLRKQGHEFGTTTGRPRRCGWFDAVACRFASRINGCDELSIMKLDVLDGFDEIKVCVAYEVNGEEIDYLPLDLENVKPVYKTFAGWDKTEGVRSFQDLPKTAQEYLKAIEELTQTKIGMISTSPDRNDTILL